MKILCDTQRTDEWFQARKAKITASSANVALMGHDTKTRRLYAEKLADDLEGLPDFADVEDLPWFTLGRYYESFARGWYSFKYGVDVHEIGFAVHDEYEWIGCSPDGLVDPNGLVEIKYRAYLHTFKEHIQVENIPRALMAQVQTQMYVCDRQWTDYVNYWRDDDNELEKGHVRRIYRDDKWIECTLLPAFLSLWEDVQVLLQERGVA